MNVMHFIKEYQNAKKNGETEKAKQLKLKMEKGGRGILSRYTSGKPFLSYPLSWITRLTESKESKQAFAKTMESYESYFNKNDKRQVHRLKRDIYFSEYNYRISADEYFRYHFENLSDYGRKTYVSETESVEKFLRIADREEARILGNKYRSYCFFKPYYKREAVVINGEQDLALFSKFHADNSRYFVKPLSLNSGRGVCCYNRDDKDDVHELLKQFTKDGAVILEQPIIQGEGMAKYHPQSINTIRIVTARINDKIEIVQSSVRLGTGNSIVDNGCLSASVDRESGIITTPGRVAHGAGLFIKHPDTDLVILGAQIPDWDDLLDLAKRLASLLKKQRIIGWDFAYSTEGWIVVEANSNPSIQILAGNGIGMRSVFDRITK